MSPFSSLAMKPCEIHDGAGRRPALLQIRIGIVGAGRREIRRAHAGVAPRLGLDDRACIDPLHVETLRREERGAKTRRHQLALRQHACAQALADFADQRDAGRDLSQALELLFELRAGNDAEVAREVAMALLDLVHDRLPLVAEGQAEQLLESVGDAGQCGMDDDGPQAFGQAIAQDCGDVLPVRDRGNAGAAELQHDPRRGAGRRISHGHSVPHHRGICGEPAGGRPLVHTPATARSGRAR